MDLLPEQTDQRSDEQPFAVRDFIPAALINDQDQRDAVALTICLCLKLYFLVRNVYVVGLPRCTSLERLAVFVWSLDVWNWHIIGLFVATGKLKYPVEACLMYHIMGYMVYSILLTYLEKRSKWELQDVFGPNTAEQVQSAAGGEGEERPVIPSSNAGQGQAKAEQGRAKTEQGRAKTEARKGQAEVGQGRSEEGEGRAETMQGRKEAEQSRTETTGIRKSSRPSSPDQESIVDATAESEDEYEEDVVSGGENAPYSESKKAESRSGSSAAMASSVGAATGGQPVKVTVNGKTVDVPDEEAPQQAAGDQKSGPDQSVQDGERLSPLKVAAVKNDAIPIPLASGGTSATSRAEGDIAADETSPLPGKRDAVPDKSDTA